MVRLVFERGPGQREDAHRAGTGAVLGGGGPRQRAAHPHGDHWGDQGDVRDVLLTGPSGLLTISPPWWYPHDEPSHRRVTWPDGTYATLLSGDQPRQLRGPGNDKAWVDELAKMMYPQQTWDMLEFTMREGINPQVVVTTTPRNIPVITKLLADPEVVVSTVSSYRNLANLSPRYIQRVLKRFEGTRLGAQELHAKVLTDTPVALWRGELIEHTRVQDLPPMQRLVVGVDPAVTDRKRQVLRLVEDVDEEESNETGIIGCGLGTDGHGYVFRDMSGIYSPREWAQERGAVVYQLRDGPGGGGAEQRRGSGGVHAEHHHAQHPGAGGVGQPEQGGAGWSPLRPCTSSTGSTMLDASRN